MINGMGLLGYHFLWKVTFSMHRSVCVCARVCRLHQTTSDVTMAAIIRQTCHIALPHSTTCCRWFPQGTSAVFYAERAEKVKHLRPLPISQWDSPEPSWTEPSWTEPQPTSKSDTGTGPNGPLIKEMKSYAI